MCDRQARWVTRSPLAAQESPSPPDPSRLRPVPAVPRRIQTSHRIQSTWQHSCTIAATPAASGLGGGVPVLPRHVAASCTRPSLCPEASAAVSGQILHSFSSSTCPRPCLQAAAAAGAKPRHVAS
eukprot:365808-Chlamydomonas_euryale.AAC.19